MLLSLCPNGWRTQRPVWGCHFDPGSLELLWLCCTKTFISHMLGTSETSQSEFASAQKGNQIAAESNTMMNTCAAWPIFTSITVQGWFFLSETFQKSFKGKVHPEGRITYSNLIAQNLSMRRNIAGRYWRISHTLPIPSYILNKFWESRQNINKQLWGDTLFPKAGGNSSSSSSTKSAHPKEGSGKCQLWFGSK